MLTQKFLIFGRPLPWAFFKSNSTNGTQTFDFEKASLLMRVAMKLHNACIDDRIEETWVLSDLTGHYETSEWRVRAQLDRRRCRLSDATTPRAQVGPGEAKGAARKGVRGTRSHHRNARTVGAGSA